MIPQAAAGLSNGRPGRLIPGCPSARHPEVKIAARRQKHINAPRPRESPAMSSSTAEDSP